MSTEQAVEQPEFQGFPGPRLQSARIAKGITVDDIASSLHLPTGYIHALENGDIDKLPSVVFARGYIRSYSKIVDIDAEEFISALDNLGGGKPQGRTVKSVTKVRQQIKASHPIIRVLTWLLLASVIGASIWWWRIQNTPIDAASVVNVAQDPIVVESSDGNTLKIPALNDSLPGDDKVVEKPEQPDATAVVKDAGAEISEVENVKSSVTSEETEKKNSNVETVKSIAEPVATSFPTVKIQFTGNCWVTIKDKNGKTLFNNARSKGEAVDVSGEGPIKVLLGASNAVSLFTFNGKTVDVNALSKNNVARFTLPLQ